METRANHVLIGLFTIIIAILGVLFALWAANWTSNRNWDNYDIIFTEAVTGLSTASTSARCGGCRWTRRTRAR
jgi:phospholipid/cholesterol/gamma-HCH transport system substrate-binding protein